MSEGLDYIDKSLIDYAEKLKSSNPKLDNAFCNAVVAVQDNYTFDSFEQSRMIRELTDANNVEELYAKLESFDIKGYDLNTPSVGCSPHVKKTA